LTLKQRSRMSAERYYLKFGNNMSRIAKKPILIPEKTEVSMKDGVLTVKGPLGEIKKSISSVIDIKVDGKEVSFTNKLVNPESKALIGTYASHLRNMLAGVHKPFEKKLIIDGIGYKYDVKPKEMILSVGLSHQVKVEIPAGLKVVADKNNLSISGIDCELVGSFANKIKSIKRPEPYKGKGIRYEGEIIRRKQGKKAA